MGQLWFAYVPAEGFVSFTKDLGSDEWGTIDTTTWEGPGRTLTHSLLETPALVTYKLQIAWSIAVLIIARDGAGSVKDCDKAWDNTQKSLRALLEAGAASSDLNKRAAAVRLQSSLLLGAGEGQTQLKYHREVDFGREQVQITSQGTAQADVALLGLQGIMAEIAAATEALAIASGHGEGNDRPAERLKAMITACATVFTGVAQQLAWAIDNGMPATDRKRAAKMREALERLSARYPAPGESPSAPSEPAPPLPDGGGGVVP